MRAGIPSESSVEKPWKDLLSWSAPYDGQKAGQIRDEQLEKIGMKGESEAGVSSRKREQMCERGLEGKR